MTEGEICTPNIGVKNRQQRRNFVIVLLGVGAVIGVVMLLFIPFNMGMSGIFQAREKTWVRLAAQGLRDMDDGPQKINDVNELAQVRKQARKVAVQLLTAAVV